MFRSCITPCITGGKEVEVTRPPDVSYHEQPHIVDSIVTKHVQVEP